MKIDYTSVRYALGPESGDLAAAARAAEEVGYDGMWSVETGHDPFLPHVQAASATERIELGTGIAVAFARSPMTMAVLANDLQSYSRGRFVLGLGSQIRPHITRRFSMPWSRPAARMREFVLALRAIWACWNEGEPLDFRGDFYQHTLMTPFFSPPPNPHGAPKVMLAGVGPRMTEVAGETCDGFLCHAFSTRRYFLEVTLPALEQGLATAGRAPEGFEVSGPAFVVTGRTEEEMAASAETVRGQVAFYGSTPAYRPVLDLHGWGDLHGELHRLSKEGRWAEMGGLVDDDVLDAFAVVAEADRLPECWTARWGGLVDRLSFSIPYRDDPDRWGQVLADLRETASASRPG